MSIHYPLPLPPYSDRDMFQYLSTPQLFVLLDCLEQSHMFARSFNSNHNQRIVLMKAGMCLYNTLYAFDLYCSL